MQLTQRCAALRHGQQGVGFVHGQPGVHASGCSPTEGENAPTPPAIPAAGLALSHDVVVALRRV